MKSLRSILKKVVYNQSGETLGETLVALLVAALALTMLAGAISASFGLITKSRTKVAVYQDNIESMVNMRASSFSASAKFTANSEKTAKYNNETGNVELENISCSTSIDIPVQSIICFENTDFGNTAVVTYNKSS